MWPFTKDLLYRGWKEALANGSSTGISVFWLGFGVLVLAFIFTVGIEWLTGGRNTAALIAALKSWKSWAGATLALLVGWIFLFGYSLLGVAYRDHQDLVAASGRTCPSVTEPPKAPKGATAFQPHITQKGDNNKVNLGTVIGDVKVGPCGVIQNGGSNNTASPNCGPPDPKIEHFEIVPVVPSSGVDGKPMTAFRFTFSAPLNDQKFIAICSRPCTARNAIASPPPNAGMSSDFTTGGLIGFPTWVAWIINIPIHADQYWVFTVESNDKEPVSIERFSIAKFPIKPQ
jgi:hypothetical protein